MIKWQNSKTDVVVVCKREVILDGVALRRMRERNGTQTGPLNKWISLVQATKKGDEILMFEQKH